MSEDRLTRLLSLRDRLTRELEECDSKRDLGTLSKELRATLVEIDALAPVEKEVSVVDEITRRRAVKGQSGA